MSDTDTGLVPVTQPFSVERVRETIIANQTLVKAHPEEEYPQGRAPAVNNSWLTGVPFYLASDWIERHKDTEVFASGKSYPAHQVAQVYVRTINPVTCVVYDPELATLSGEYLLNQFRSNLLDYRNDPGPFTIWENPKFLRKDGKTHPLMLVRYDPAKHKPLDETEPSVFDELSTFNGKSVEPVASPETQTYTASENNPYTQMRRANISEADLLDAAGWDTLDGKSHSEISMAIRLLSRERELVKVPAGSDVREAARRTRK